MGRTGSSRDESIEQRENMVDEGQNALLGGVDALAVIHGSADAHEGAVAAAHPDGILYQVVLGPPFAGDAATVGPEPVQNEFAGVALGDDITVDREWFVARHGERNALILHRCPARAGEAVLR